MVLSSCGGDETRTQVNKFKIRNGRDTREVKQILTDKVRGLRGGHVHLQVAETEKPGSIETWMIWNPPNMDWAGSEVRVKVESN